MSEITIYPIGWTDPVKTYTSAVQAHLDTVAQANGYDSIVSACSYAGAVNPYQAQGAAAIAWRGAVWVACYTLILQVQAGTIPAPTIAALIAGLPVITWP